MKTFINSFANWQETHFEICAHLANTKDVAGTLANDTITNGGTGSLYELAEELTDQFEIKHAGKIWDGDFMDEMQLFLADKEAKLNYTMATQIAL